MRLDPVTAYVERDLRNFSECGILAHGFARARCEKCGQDFLVAYSCKGRGVCPGCNTRRMLETAAHMVEHVFPAVPASIAPSQREANFPGYQSSLFK